MPKRSPFDWSSGELPSLWELLGERPPTGQTYGPAGKLASDVMNPREYFDSQYNTGSGRIGSQPERMYWGDDSSRKLEDYLSMLEYDALEGLRGDPEDTQLSRYSKHGAVPENVKQSYLDDMLDYYGNTNMQHMLVPQKYIDFDEMENVKARGAGKPVTLNMVDKTRYVPAEGAVDMGHMGPDYITMMNIMKGQKDKDFDIGFMSEDYMKSAYNPDDVIPGTDLPSYEGKPNVGAYFQSYDQAIGLNPYDILDFSDPLVDKAFSQGAGKPRTLGDLEGTSLQIGEDTDPWNLNVLAHELGHYGTNYGWFNKGKDKFNMPNIITDENMTRYVEDERIMGTPGHNEAYWIGRRHEPYYWKKDWFTNQPKHGNMNLTEAAATNIRDWTNEAKQHVDRANQPRLVADYTPPSGASDFGTPNFAPSNTTPSRSRHHFNTGGIAGLPGQWTPSMAESEEEDYNIRPLQLDPGIMSIEDLADLFEEVGLDKSIIYKLINSGGLSQLVS